MFTAAWYNEDPGQMRNKEKIYESIVHEFLSLHSIKLGQYENGEPWSQISGTVLRPCVILGQYLNPIYVWSNNSKIQL